MAPSARSRANSASSKAQARGPSCGVTHIEVLVSEEVCATIKTLMPPRAKVSKIRRFTPMTPTIEGPLTVTMLISLTEEIPRIGRSDCRALLRMTLPRAEGLNVFLTKMGIFLAQTG